MALIAAKVVEHRVRDLCSELGPVVGLQRTWRAERVEDEPELAGDRGCFLVGQSDEVGERREDVGEDHDVLAAV